MVFITNIPLVLQSKLAKYAKGGILDTASQDKQNHFIDSHQRFRLWGYSSKQCQLEDCPHEEADQRVAVAAHADPSYQYH